MSNEEKLYFIQTMKLEKKRKWFKLQVMSHNIEKPDTCALSTHSGLPVEAEYLTMMYCIYEPS